MMPKEKKSFFERLTGSVRIDNEEEARPETRLKVTVPGGNRTNDEREPEPWVEEEEKEGQLTVDVYQNNDSIVIKTMVAGVRPEDLDITITRDLVTIKGKREEERGLRDEDYFIRELYWGSFSRTITLPEEIEVEEAEAMERHGLLIIKLPKVDKGRQTKLRVKTIS